MLDAQNGQKSSLHNPPEHCPGAQSHPASKNTRAVKIFKDLDDDLNEDNVTHADRWRHLVIQVNLGDEIFFKDFDLVHTR